MYLWRKLISIDNVETRHNLALLSGLSLVCLICFVSIFTYYVVAGYPFTLFTFSLNLVVFCGMVAAYVLSRLGYENVAVYTFIITLSLGIVVTAVSEDNAVFYINYLVLPILLSSIFLNTFQTIILIVAYLVILMLLPQLFDYIIYDDLPFFFLLLFTILLRVVTNHQRNIEKDKQAALRDSEERYRSLFTSLSDSVIVLEEGRFIDMNNAFLQLMGYTREELIGQTPMDSFVHPDYREAVMVRIEAKAEATLELAGITKGGATIPLEATGMTYIYHGAFLRVVVLRDISERKLAEKRQLELGLERGRVQLMKQFITNASHDFRTPLTVLNSSAHLLRIKADDKEWREKYLSRIEKQVIHLNDMVENLLSVSRLDKAAGKKWDLIQGDLNTLMQNQADEQVLYAEIKNVTLTFEPDKNLHPVYFDEDELMRAIRQLVTNAINYTSGKEDGRVVLRTLQREDVAVIEVQDNGIGMSAESVQHIFEMFYRIDDARNADTGGLGLGLGICKEIVEAHHGNVEVESVPDEGSTFRVILPVKRVTSEA